jgi:flagellar biosynthesis protein FliQ
MDADQVISFSQQGLWTVLTVASPVLAAVLVVGLVVGLLQTMTQLQEAALSFVPKVLAVLGVLTVAGPWMVGTLVDYLRQVLGNLPSALG